jgi:methionine synthase I (cobalamin-dependent)
VSDPAGQPEPRRTRGRAFPEAVARGPVVLDAAIGTRLIARGLDLAREDPALWVLDRPADVFDLHALDVAAGSDAVLTNTFGANRRWLDRFGRADDAAAINRHASALARDAAGPDRFVIGSVGPTSADDPGALIEQVEALAAGGVNALLFETYRADQAERALKTLGPRRAGAVPWLVSLVDWPQAETAELARRLEGLGAWALGVNCVSGMAPALRIASALAGVSRLPLLVKPSVGLPGEPPATPESFGAAVPALLACGVRLIGGCCGTTDEHVAALRAACYDATIHSPAGGSGPARDTETR